MGRRQRAPSRKDSTDWALAGKSVVVAGGCWGSPGGRLKISSLFGCSRETAALSHPTYTWEWGELLLRGADASRGGRATSIRLRDWDLAPVTAKFLGKKQHSGSCCSITANVKQSPLWHEACWKGFVHNCVKLSQAKYSALNFYYSRAERHQQRGVLERHAERDPCQMRRTCLLYWEALRDLDGT